MENLSTLIPDVEALLALAPEELAPIILKFARAQTQHGIFHPNNMSLFTRGPGTAAAPGGYPPHRVGEVETAISEAWQWLRINMLVVPASGTNGVNGWLMLSRRGAALTDAEKFQKFKEAAKFPKSLLHPSITDKVWLALARGDLDDAVFVAFKAVEEAVREAGGYGPSDIGVDLMRKAFDPKNGPLTVPTQPKGEREALAHLFAGAIGSYKNPHSHRTVSITDPREAQEMVLLASHLLRIVDARRPQT